MISACGRVCACPSLFCRFEGGTAPEQGASSLPPPRAAGTCVHARLIQIIFIKSLAVLPCLPWRIKCMVLGFVSGLTEYNTSSGSLGWYTPWWTALVCMGEVCGWAELHDSVSLKEAALVSIGWKVYQVELQMFLMTGICVDLAQKNCFLSFAVSCTAKHSTEKEFFSILFQKTLDNLLLFHSLWSHISAKKKIQRGGWGSLEENLRKRPPKIKRRENRQCKRPGNRSPPWCFPHWLL